ncbi:MAG: hypothetical protein M3N31_06820 [Actinomycetota bacterium]|nr:hypothetical protein [Actinomycetota bacterium]
MAAEALWAGARAGARAGAVAAVVSGAPSTAVALYAGRDPLEPIRAAGSMVGSPTLMAGAAVHLAISLGWGVVLAAVLPRRSTVLWGAAAGAAIAALDLGLLGRRFARIRALAVRPQVADHVAFGAVAGAVLSASRSR